ncbi:hypothetical protein DH86_00003754, partial [Scytalidium sp. 3C]
WNLQLLVIPPCVLCERTALVYVAEQDRNTSTVRNRRRIKPSEPCTRAIMIRQSLLRRNLPFGSSFTSTTRHFSLSAPRNRINKILPSASEAISKVKSGDTLLVGGFGLSGVPASLINALRDQPALKGFTVVSNNAGMPGIGLGQLLETRQISKMIASFIGQNKVFEKIALPELLVCQHSSPPPVMAPTIPIRYNPDGTVAIRSKPKETREFNGKGYVMEEAIFGDVALVRVHRADRLGNCQFRSAQNNFNEAMAKNAKYTIVEADHIVEVGEIKPNDIHIQGVYVDAVIQSTEPKQIEKTTFSKEEDENKDTSIPPATPRERIIRRAALELKDGMVVNLGIGIPLAAPAYLPKDIEIILQAENGVLGMGRYPRPGEEDPDLINPGKETVTLNTGAS